MLVHNLFTDTVLTAAVIYRPLKSYTDSWHEVGKVVKEATVRDLEDPVWNFHAVTE